MTDDLVEQPADNMPEEVAVHRDWLSHAVDDWGLGRIAVRERAHLLAILRKHYAAHAVKLIVEAHLAAARRERADAGVAEGVPALCHA